MGDVTYTFTLLSLLGAGMGTVRAVLWLRTRLATHQRGSGQHGH